MGGDGALRVEETFSDGFVRLRVQEAERRQAKHDIRSVEDALIELLRNARDASARYIYVISSRKELTRSLVLIDDGQGIPQALTDTIFEPRVTSKLSSMHIDRYGVHGRGMALYAIRANALQAKVYATLQGQGTAMAAAFDVALCPEKTDQSTVPILDIHAEEESPSYLRGPHNLIRVAAEFALEHPELQLYYGSPSEILATIRHNHIPQLSETDLLFVDDVGQYSPIQRLVCSRTPQELQKSAASNGIAISERTAHRILTGAFQPLKNLRTILLASTSKDSDTQKKSSRAIIDLLHDQHNVHFAPEDLDELKSDVSRILMAFSAKYFMEPAETPRVFIKGNTVHITTELRHSDESSESTSSSVIG